MEKKNNNNNKKFLVLGLERDEAHRVLPYINYYCIPPVISYIYSGTAGVDANLANKQDAMPSLCRMRMNLHLLTEMKRDSITEKLMLGTPYGGGPYTKRNAGNAHRIFSVHPPYVHRKSLVTKGRG